MNKKFLSAILFGALMVTSTGTFVSCKDYDDDIKELNGRVDGVESQIKDLQAKINDGKWITNVTSVTGGFTVTFSDATSYTIVNGEAGVAGKDGAEWTITEDGFWACNGEKTTVKAVGQNGQDAQPEVKKENGKWYLWNAETKAFEEVTVDAPAATGIPFYYVDPTDPNYTILVMFDENGGNKKEIRLPMTSGLGQIVLLGEDLGVKFHTFNGAHFTNGKSTTWKYDGSKELPAVGEYLLTASENAIYVQVVPSNYDISKLNFKLVNTKGEEAPIVLGTPTPCTEAVSRAVSESGVYSISFTLPEMTNDVLSAYNKNIAGKALSLVASESVRSTYTYGLGIQPAGTNENLVFGKFINPQNAELGMPYTVKFDSNAEYVYDSYLTMANATAKADSVRYGIKVEGMTISYSKEMPENTSIEVTANQLNARGIVSSAESTTIYFGAKAETPQNIVLDAVAHSAVAIHTVSGKEENKQYMDVDFKEYFDVVTPTEGDRLLWNNDMVILRNAAIYWTEIDAQGNMMAEKRITDLYDDIDLLDAKGKVTTELKDFVKMRIYFKANYGSTVQFGNGSLRAALNVYNQTAGELAQTVEIPFTIANPTATEIATWYNWNKTNNFENGTLTIVKEWTGPATISLVEHFQQLGTVAPDFVTMNNVLVEKEGVKVPNMKIGFPSTITADADKAKVTFATTNYATEANLTIASGAGAKFFNVAYTISGIQVKAMDRVFDVPSIKVVFKGSTVGRENVITFSKSLQTPNDVSKSIRITNSLYAPNNNNDGKTYFGSFTLADYLGNKYALQATGTSVITVYASDDSGEITATESADIEAKIEAYNYTVGDNTSTKAQGITFKALKPVGSAGKSFKVFVKITKPMLDGQVVADVTVPVTILVK